MNTVIQTIDSEISSLASSIRKSMVNPVEQRIENLELRLSAAERAILFVTKAFFAAGVIFAATMGTVIYLLATN